METSSVAGMAGAGLLGLLVALVVAVFAVALSALLLSLAFRMVVGIMPSYLRSLGAVLLMSALSVAFHVVVSTLLPVGLGGALTVVLEFVIGAAVVNYLLQGPNGQIGYGKACLVQLLYLVFFTVVVAVVLLVMLGGMLANVRVHG